MCRDEDDRKSSLLDTFSTHVAKVTNVKEKAVLQQWLEDSFNATEDIEGIVSRAEAGGPLVYLDLDPNIDLTRTELLEVSKSCHAGVLKKIASVFTHLKVVILPS